MFSHSDFAEARRMVNRASNYAVNALALGIVDRAAVGDPMHAARWTGQGHTYPFPYVQYVLHEPAARRRIEKASIALVGKLTKIDASTLCHHPQAALALAEPLASRTQESKRVFKLWFDAAVTTAEANAVLGGLTPGWAFDVVQLAKDPTHALDRSSDPDLARAINAVALGAGWLDCIPDVLDPSISAALV